MSKITCNLKTIAYCITIAYHVGLNAVLGWPQASGQRLRKKDIYSWHQVAYSWYSMRSLPTFNQYLDDWLVRAPCRETCLRHTQTLLALCRELGWVVNMKKSGLTPQQVFNFVGYWFDLLTSRVLLTQERWVTLQQKLNFIKEKEFCTVRQFMSLMDYLQQQRNKYGQVAFT